MDGENNGKPYEQMDDLGGFPPIFGSTPMSCFYGEKSGITKSDKTTSRFSGAT